MRIIGLCGRKAAGKNYVADRIRQIAGFLGQAVDQAAFANPLKEYAINVLGLKREYVYGSDAQKNIKTDYLWENMPSFVRERNPGKSGRMSHREVLQVAGSELGRMVWGDDIWINIIRLSISLSSADYFVITDVRFPDEADMVREYGGEVWLIKGPPSSVDAHMSEAIDSVVVDRVIENDYSRPGPNGDLAPDDLEEQIRTALGLVTS